jgi:hypothetical protein
MKNKTYQGVVMSDKDKEYIIERNKLIPVAEEYADKVAGLAPNSSEKAYSDWIKLWNLSYHARMNLLAQKCGLI